MTTNRYVSQVPAALCALAASSAFEWGIVRAAAGASTKILNDVAVLDGGLPVRYTLHIIVIINRY
jgi:hypothetical protein